MLGRALFAMLSLIVSASGWAVDFDHSAWSASLARHVEVSRGGHETRVRYRSWLQDRAALDAYLVSTSTVTVDTFDRWTKSEQLAFLINVYNARTIELVLTRYPDLNSIRDLGSWWSTPWQQRFFDLLGSRRSLDDLEHSMIREGFDEPRVHFALNCASLGCPALRWEAYRGAVLDRQLDDAVRRFLGDDRRNRVGDGRIELSSLFKWYRDDFEQTRQRPRGLREFLLAYGDALKLDAAMRERLNRGVIDIRFLDYDWRLNDVP